MNDKKEKNELKNIEENIINMHNLHKAVVISNKN